MDRKELPGRRVVLVVIMVVSGIVISLFLIFIGLMFYYIIPEWQRDDLGWLLIAGLPIVAGVLIAIGCIAGIIRVVRGRQGGGDTD